MQNKKMIRVVIVLVVIAAVIALVSTVGPTLFDALLAMHGL